MPNLPNIDNMDRKELIERYHKYDRYKSWIVLIDFTILALIYLYIYFYYGNISISVINDLPISLWDIVAISLIGALSFCYWMFATYNGEIYQKLYPESKPKTWLGLTIMIVFAIFVVYLRQNKYLDSLFSEIIFFATLIIISMIIGYFRKDKKIIK